MVEENESRESLAMHVDDAQDALPPHLAEVQMGYARGLFVRESK